MLTVCEKSRHPGHIRARGAARMGFAASVVMNRRLASASLLLLVACGGDPPVQTEFLGTYNGTATITGGAGCATVLPMVVQGTDDGYDHSQRVSFTLAPNCVLTGHWTSREADNRDDLTSGTAALDASGPCTLPSLTFTVSGGQAQRTAGTALELDVSGFATDAARTPMLLVYHGSK
jgi:hypothetical protein